MLECSASAVFAALYSLANPRPTEATRITPMITASLPWPRNADAKAVTASRISSGDPQLAHKHRPRPGPVRTHRVRAHHLQPPRRLTPRQAPRAASQPRQNIRNPSAAASTAGTGDGTAVLCLPPETATATATSFHQPMSSPELIRMAATRAHAA